MLVRVYSCALTGMAGHIVEVEVDRINHPDDRTVLVGLPDAAVQESRERVRGAIRNSCLDLPRGGITVINLAPADLRKEGPNFDLPIALGEMMSAYDIVCDALNSTLVIGELSLDGSVRHVRGVLLIASAAREAGFKAIICPYVDAAEAALVPGIEVLGVRNLAEAFRFINGESKIEPFPPYQFEYESPAFSTDFSEIKGQEHVKRALEISAAGAHNMLMSGPPGSGKTLLARALPSIMPSMTAEECLDVTRIYSLMDALPANVPLIRTRPFRAPHHTVSYAGLVGGGNVPRPGEISMAHRGVLFLDEFPEFPRPVLEVLRQPLEDKIVTISRATGSFDFPANFILVAAMNPCPCGFYGDPTHQCSCSQMTVRNYQKRISGPLLDRIDISVNVPRVEYEKLSSDTVGEPSEKVRARVEAARNRQLERFKDIPHVTNNTEMGPAEIRRFCKLDAESDHLLRTVMERFGLSARVYHRLLKLSRTIADLEGSDAIRPAHIAEAIQYRPKQS